MADISKEIQDFKNAMYGEEVRGSLVSLAQKVNNETEINTKHVDGAVNVANSAGIKANEAAENALVAISKADVTLNEAITAKETAKSSATQAVASAENAAISSGKASEAAKAAQGVADGLGGFNGKAESVSYQDTYGLGKSNLQLIIDEVTRRVVNEVLYKKDKYDGLDSTSTELVPTANSVRQVNEKTDKNATAITTLNRDLEGKILPQNTSDDVRIVTPNDAAGTSATFYLSKNGKISSQTQKDGANQDWYDYVTGADLISKTEIDCNAALPGYHQVRIYSVRWSSNMPISGDHDFTLYACPAHSGEDRNFVQMAICTRSATANNAGKIYTRSCVGGTFGGWVEK